MSQVYDQDYEIPVEIVRCLRCNRTVEKFWMDAGWHEDECDGVQLYE